MGKRWMTSVNCMARVDDVVAIIAESVSGCDGFQRVGRGSYKMRDDIAQWPARMTESAGAGT